MVGGNFEKSHTGATWIVCSCSILLTSLFPFIPHLQAEFLFASWFLYPREIVNYASIEGKQSGLKISNAEKWFLFSRAASLVHQYSAFISIQDELILPRWIITIKEETKKHP